VNRCGSRYPHQFAGEVGDIYASADDLTRVDSHIARFGSGVPGQQRCLAQFGEFVLVGCFFGATAYDHAPADLVGSVDAKPQLSRSRSRRTRPVSVKVTQMAFP
jgi:hypothetical protein